MKLLIYLYRFWRFLYTSFWTFLGLLTFVFVLGFGFLQSQWVKNRIVGELEERSRTETVEVHIDRLSGLIPFYFNFHKVALDVTDSTSAVKALHVEQVYVRPQIWSLLQGDLRFAEIIVYAPELWTQAPEVTEKFDLRQLEKGYADFLTQLDRQSIFIPALTVERLQWHAKGGKVRRFVKGEMKELDVDVDQARFMIDLTAEQRFVEILELRARLKDFPDSEVSVRGQIFNDDSFFEINHLTLSGAESYLDLSVEATEFNSRDSLWFDQVKKNGMRVSLDSSYVFLPRFAFLDSTLKAFTDVVFVEMSAFTQGDSLNVEHLNLRLADSEVSLHAGVRAWTQSSASGNVVLDRFFLDEPGLVAQSAAFGIEIPGRWQWLRGKGRIGGRRDSLTMQVEGSAPIGQVSASGKSIGGRDGTHSFELKARDLELGAVLDRSDVSKFGADISIILDGFPADSLQGSFLARIDSFSTKNMRIPAILASGQMREGYLDGQAKLQLGQSSVEMDVHAKPTQAEKIVADLRFKKIDLKSIFIEADLPKSSISGTSRIALEHFDLAKMTGKLQLALDEIILQETDTLAQQQLFLELKEMRNNQRRARFSSSFAFGEMVGDFDLQRLINHSQFWRDVVNRSVQHELLMRAPLFEKVVPVDSANFGRLDLKITAKIKDLGYLSRFSERFDVFETQASFSSTVQSDSESIILDGRIEDDTLRVSKVLAQGLSGRITFGITAQKPVREQSNVRILLDVTKLQVGKAEVDSLSIRFSQENEQIGLNFIIEDFGKEAHASMFVDGTLSLNEIAIKLSEFDFGTPTYTWKAVGNPQLRFSRQGVVAFDGLTFQNESELISLDGSFSPEKTDSVIYLFSNVKLGRISDVLQPEAPFSGLLNGSFITKTLRSDPFVQGSITVDSLTMSQRIIGDLVLSSFFDTDQNRLDVFGRMLTDSVRYGSYLAQNNGVGQDFTVNGYLEPLGKLTSDRDTLFYADVEFNSIDAWVITPLVDGIFSKLEGHAKGKGFFFASREHIDFDGDFTVLDSKLVPEFLNAELKGTGAVKLTRHEGMEIVSARIEDRFGGVGTLNGRLGFNDFKRDKPLDFSLDFTNLRLLNNSFSQDVVFYGAVTGTGRLLLKGVNTAPVLRSEGSISISNNSTLSIPLLDQQSVEQENNFIVFVSDFNRANVEDKQEGSQPRQTSSPQKKKSRRFNELFTLDLEFDIPEFSTVRLIFDPVTGEILTARGSGQIQLTLDAEQFQMFGRFDVAEGTYLFTGGDLLMRRFELQNGGIITWDGDPENGSIDVNAVYRSRVDISPLVPQAVLNSDGNSSPNRIPVLIDLVLNITGRLNALQNDFSFELSKSLGVTQDANLLSAINQLNSPENKFIQATSLLLTGNFIQTSQSTQQNLGSDFDNRVTQSYFATLLSNQINQLLSNSISNLDVAINMQGFDQFDQTELGVALRLFNDRLVLRREGEIGGQNNNIGDVGATYRINRVFSLEIFHRQDPTQSNFGNVNNTNQQSINGIGLEAQVAFNSWNELQERISKSLKNILSKKKKAKDQKENSNIESIEN